MRRFTDIYLNATQSKHGPSSKQRSENVLLRRLFRLQCEEVSDLGEERKGFEEEMGRVGRMVDEERKKMRALGEKVRAKVLEDWGRQRGGNGGAGGAGGTGEGGFRGVDSC